MNHRTQIPIHRQRQDRLLRPEQAAKYLGICTETLRRWEKAGKITSYRTLGGKHRRYPESEIMIIRELSAPTPLPQPQPEPHRGLIRRGIRRLLGKGLDRMDIAYRTALTALSQ